MSINVYVLDADPALAPYRESISDAASVAVERVRRHLVVNDVDVVVACNRFAVIGELGVGGYSPSGHLAYVSVDPEHPRFREVLDVHLSRALAHELHHCVRWRGPGYGTSLGEALVTEGLADHFDLEVHPGQEPYFWAKSLDSGAWRETWDVARDHLWDSDYDHSRWFFNTDGGFPPFHAGYALGFEAVREFLVANPELRASDLVATPATRILEGDKSSVTE